MALTNSDINSLYLLAQKAAQMAGTYIGKQNQKRVQVRSKDGGDSPASCVVTEVDLKAQEIILQQLSNSLKKYDLGLLTEESTDDGSRFEKDYFWCIDPLDGTLAFSQRQSGYSTSIALVSKSGTAVFGVVYDPNQGNLYHACQGHGAFKNKCPLRVQDQADDLTLLYDHSYSSHPHYRHHLEYLQSKLIKQGLTQLIISPRGGAVMNALAAIETSPALYYKVPKATLGGGSLWDFAATSVIALEAGGHCSDYLGNPLKLNDYKSTFMNNKGIIYASSSHLLDLVPPIESPI